MFDACQALFRVYRGRHDRRAPLLPWNLSQDLDTKQRLHNEVINSNCNTTSTSANAVRIREASKFKTDVLIVLISFANSPNWNSSRLCLRSSLVVLPVKWLEATASMRLR